MQHGITCEIVFKKSNSEIESRKMVAMGWRWVKGYKLSAVRGIMSEDLMDKMVTILDHNN